jgi:hypothetical protein
MRTKISFYLFVSMVVVRSITLTAQAPGSCKPSVEALAKLSAYVAYQNGRDADTNVERSERVSVISLDGRFFFLSKNAPVNFAPGYKPVFVYGASSGIQATTCPETQWTKCAVDWATQARSTATSGAGMASLRFPESQCEIDLSIPRCNPSPETDLKKRLAAEVLREVAGTLNYKEVYVRDFNVQDPNLDFYLVNENGEGEFQGCDFDPTRRPHCTWHMYGMTPRDWLKRNVMERPYRLFPSTKRLRD